MNDTTTATPFFPQHEVHVGRDLGGRTATIREADVQHYETGTGGSTLRLRLDAVLWQLRRVFLLFVRRQVISAHDVLQAVNTALMISATEMPLVARARQ